MPIAAFVIAVIAAVLFGVEGARVRPFALVPIGLCLLTVALIIQFAHPVANVHF